MVDHRGDWTYTVVVPHGEPLAGWRGAESYRQIHAALAEALHTEGVAACLSRGEEETGASLCFENPVSHDLLGADGRLNDPELIERLREQAIGFIDFVEKLKEVNLRKEEA